MYIILKVLQVKCDMAITDVLGLGFFPYTIYTYLP